MNTSTRSSLRAEFPTRPTPAKLAHIVLRTARFDEMKRFYKAFFGATTAFENSQVSFLAYDDEHHRIGLINFPHLQPMDTSLAGMEHVAFTYSDLRTLLAAYIHNKDYGILPFWSINHGPTISMYYKDPDGNKIELQHDVFDKPELVDAFFASGAYEENFMGIIFDPDEMIAALEDGQPEDVLTKRPNLPAGATPWDMLRE